MKITHILAIVLIAGAVGIIVASMGDASKYVHFEEAFQMAAKGNNNKIHVVGELKKDTQGNILGMHYDPVQNANLFTFVMIDEQGKEQRVYYNDAKPQDFERSEKVVVIGSVKGEHFVASKILMKCPSKYQGQGTETIEAEARPRSS